MARSRRGGFGLQPRVVPNINSTVVALAREYVSQRDALIMDAWKNGGTFEGHKATDQMVLAYWKERETGLDPQDPEFEQAKDQIMQLQYGIEQSKADVLHVQGKLSDGAYAQFFLKWAKKVPANSEFYRTLQKDAAQLIEQSKASGRAKADKAKADSFNAFVKGTTDKDIAIGDAMTTALSKLSKDTGLSITGNGDELLAMLTSDVKANPDKYKVLLDTIKTGDIHWDGNLTEGYFTQHIKTALQGYELIADKAKNDGFVSAYASAADGMATMTGWGQNLKVWPISQSYSDIVNAANKVINDPNASQMDKVNAGAKASAQLTALGQTPGIDAGSKTMIDADALRLIGQDGGDSPSFGSAMLGREGVSPQTTMQIGAWVATKALVDANPTAFAYASVDKNGNYDPTGSGPLGMVPAGALQPGAVAVMVPGADGKAVLAMVAPHSVYTTDPNNPNGSPRFAGNQITYNVGGKVVQLWGYQDDHGTNHWSIVSPLAPGSTTTVDSKGDVYVTSGAAATPIDQQIASLKDKDGNPVNLTDEQKTALHNGGTIKTNQTTAAKGKAGESTSISISVHDGYLQQSTVVDQVDDKGNILSSETTPIQLTGTAPKSNAFSSSALSAGDIPGVTFSSPLGASVAAASYTQTQDQVSKFASDPAFQQAFLSQTMAVLGINNPYDPRIADAWKNATTQTREAEVNTLRSIGPLTAAARADLRFPGDTQSKSGLGANLNINYGNGQTLQLPGLPGYLKDQTLSGPGNGGSGPGWLTNSPVAPLLPGLGVGVPSSVPPQTQSGSPTPVVTPTQTSPSGTITPTNGSTIAPASAPSGAPAPTSKPGGKYGMTPS